MRVLDATVTRRTRTGEILGPEQRVVSMTGLKAMTLWPAWQHFEETEKGSIEPGKQADFAILTKDPTAVDPETIDQIDVAMTVKADKVIFQASPGEKEGRFRRPPFASDPVTAHMFMHAIYQGIKVEKPWLSNARRFDR